MSAVPVYLTAAEAAERLGCGRSNVYSLCRKGQLVHFHFAGELRIEDADLEDFMRRHVRPRREVTATVYLAYDLKGELLYVGITGRKLRRLNAHARSARWWNDATEIRLEHYYSRAAAERRESWLIKHATPRHNIAGRERLPA